MIKRKYMLVLALAFCLTATLFVVTSIGYDPWVDQDEDGDIDAADLNVLAGEYGSTGDPTKNVSVTNWPEPDKPIFTEILALRGAHHALYYTYGFTHEYDEWTLLLDEDMPYPPIAIDDTKLFEELSTTPTSWTPGETVNFTHEAHPQKPYFIQGSAVIRPTLEYYFENPDLLSSDTVYFNVTVHLEKVNPENVPSILTSNTLSVAVNVPADSSITNTMSNMGFTFKFPEPVWIEGERLRIRFETWYRSESGLCGFCALELKHTVGTDEFIAYIPIYQP